jgi:phosphate-selective porin OprO/OprP
MAPETSLLNLALRFQPVSFKRGIALRRRIALGLVTAFTLAAFAHLFPPVEVHASELSPPAAHSSSNSVSQAKTGPEGLRQRVRVTVETNAPPAGATTNAVAAREKSFDWESSWEGWNGLHLELTRKTLLGRFLPGVTNLEQPNLGKLTGLSIPGTNTYRLRLDEDKMTMKIGAKVQVDGAAYDTGSQFKGFDDGIELRRFRVYAQGDCVLVMPVSFEIELGYIPNQFYIENSYLAFRNLPWIGEVKFGQFQAPMGLDAVTSSRDTTMMELASPLAALAPGVNAGVETGRPLFDQRATWKLGFFTAGEGTQDTGDAANNYGRAITRITALPIYEPNPNHPGSATLLHLGLSANYLYSANSAVRYRSRPESHLAPYIVDTGNIHANGALVAGAEAAWVNGPFSLQAEYLHSWVNEEGGQMPGLEGAYTSVSYFLTGESRPYNRQDGCFTRVIPHHNFDWGQGGWGALEIAARASYVNLNSDNVHGGRLAELMTGANWYLHSHVKWRFEYGLAHVTGHQPEGNINIFQTRMEVDF